MHSCLRVMDGILDESISSRKDGGGRRASGYTERSADLQVATSRYMRTRAWLTMDHAVEYRRKTPASANQLDDAGNRIYRPATAYAMRALRPARSRPPANDAVSGHGCTSHRSRWFAPAGIFRRHSTGRSLRGYGRRRPGAPVEQTIEGGAKATVDKTRSRPPPRGPILVRAPWHGTTDVGDAFCRAELLVCGTGAHGRRCARPREVRRRRTQRNPLRKGFPSVSASLR